jgi:ribosomal protein L37AE/L43A
MGPRLSGFGEINPLKDLKRKQELEKQSESHEECDHDWEGVRIRSDEDEPSSGFWRCKKCGMTMD